MGYYAGSHGRALCIPVELNLRELTALRSLIVAEVKREGCDPVDRFTWTPKVKRMHSVARKIHRAQEALRAQLKEAKNG